MWLLEVSIHAPARGATYNKTRSQRIENVSIHAPARGATRSSNQMVHKAFVSIHAPARGATLKPPSLLLRTLVSIHAPARGATMPHSPKDALPSQFQSTHPRGVRRYDPAQPGVQQNQFQSTHPRGVRHFTPTRYPLVIRVSIHAPARGATCRYSLVDFLRIVSIHAPARGATYCKDWQIAKELGFQSTHPRGVRPGQFIRMLSEYSVSIHAPARGATRRIGNYFFEHMFQSTHPRGVRLHQQCL